MKRLIHFWHGMSNRVLTLTNFSNVVWFRFELCIAFLKLICGFLFSSLICSGLEALLLWNVCFSYSLAASIFSNFCCCFPLFSFFPNSLFCLFRDRFSHISSFLPMLWRNYFWHSHHCWPCLIYRLLPQNNCWHSVGNTADFITWNYIIVII